jgi:hypothetical protein
MAVNPTISVIYTKKVEGGGQGGKGVPSHSKKGKATNSSNFFKGIKNPQGFLMNKAMSGLGGMAVYMAVAQTASKLTSIYTQVNEARTGNKVSNYNLNQAVNAFKNPLGYIKKGLWEYGVIEPMVVARQNEALMYDRVLTGQMVYGEGKQRGIF